MSRIEELPDDYREDLPSQPIKNASNQPLRPEAVPVPALPPHLADARHQTVDEVVADLKRTPFFMNSIEDAGDEDNPELDAIKALMYEGTRAEIAENFREQGNEMARAKKWKDGKELYTKGIQALQAERGVDDPRGQEEEAKEKTSRELLLVNRALCHLELQNYRSCTLDCISALELSPRNVKAHYRLASALFALSKLPQAMDAATAGLALDPDNTPLQTLHQKIHAKQAAEASLETARRDRKNLAEKKKLTLVQALGARKIRTRTTATSAPDMPDDAVLQLTPDPLNAATSTLIFPVIVLYPLHAQSDIIKQFGEAQTLNTHLDYLLPLPWDSAGEYSAAEKVEAYMETVAGGLIKWGKNVELLRVISGGKVEVVDGIVRVSFVPKARAGEYIEGLRKRKKGAG